MTDANFWLKRIEQQADYIVRFYNTPRTRPDAEAVRQSAIYILERCQERYLKAKNPV